jgi:hypothetical protein
MNSVVETKQHCQFEFTSSFNREFDCMMKLYDETYATLSKVVSSSTVDIPNEYGVCNNNYKFRYIKPENIASYISYLMKALKKDLISPNYDDLEKFSVQSVKNFMKENECVPIENSSIYGLYRYTSDTMTLKDLTILCENDVYHTSVCSKFDMTQRKSAMKQDWNTIVNMHFSTNIKKMVNSIPTLMKSTDYCEMDMYVRDAIRTYVESFILFSIMMNAITLSNMTLYCVPKSTYDMNLIDKPNKVEENSLLEKGDMEDTFVENGDKKPESHKFNEYFTECCLLKTNNMVFNNKIPFNINMSNIVLQDTHPQFKDTRSAIHFITKDSRSPISQLLIKYSSNDPACIYSDPMTIVNMFTHFRDPMCSNKDAYAKHHEMDFHTDPNWLDKIAYGNNYLNGNYRDDGMGNHHMDPIRNTLDTLYRMYGDCSLVESKDLADHIIKVSSLMNGIINAYSEFRIENWEMVRDILAVLGEIMTRCMIKLYNNHMTIFVATDNMDDVDVPGYLYTESFVMEAESDKPRVDVTDANGDNKQQTFAQKAKMTIAQLFHKFITWVHNVLEKAPFKFNENHKMEKDWIDKNKELNKEIIQALSSGKFTATTTNFPHYKIPANDLTASPTCVTDAVKKRINDMNSQGDNKPNTQPSDLRSEIYPPKLYNKMKGNQNIDVQQERTWVTNYLLYGDPDHEYIDHNPQPLKDTQFAELINNINGTFKLLSDHVAAVEKDLGNALDICEKESNALVSKQKSEANSEEKTPDIDKKISDMNALLKELQNISSSYHVAMNNIISSKFYATSYALYRDIVTAYQQQKKQGLNNVEQPEQPQTATTAEQQPAQGQAPQTNGV